MRESSVAASALFDMSDFCSNQEANPIGRATEASCLLSSDRLAQLTTYTGAEWRRFLSQYKTIRRY